MSESFVGIDLGESGTLYVRSLGNDRFAHVYVTTDPDGGGPIGQTNTITVGGISYHVSAHPELNEDGRTIEDWKRGPDGAIRRDRIHIARVGSIEIGGVSAAAQDEIRILIERACAEYLARPESTEEIREARADHLRMRIERLEQEASTLEEKLGRVRTTLEANRATLKRIS